jgi:DNA-binding NarL/FixJ family response regulator
VIRTEKERSFAHYGTPRHSGRYPWGSGQPESTRNRSFLDTVEMHTKAGMSEAEIAKGFGISVKQMRARKSIAVAQERQTKILQAERYKEKGWSNSEIGRRMNINESSVRALLAPGAKDRADAIQTTANILKDKVKEHELVDVGRGSESLLGITKTRLDTSIEVLREQGYELHNVKVLQAGTGKYTNMKVLAPPGTPWSHVQQNKAKIKPIIDTYSEDNGRTFLGIQPPISVNSRRIRVNYKETGGDQLDGLIYVRPGVKDLSFGNSVNYAQVRIMVDKTHYIKGMAVYRNDLPPGVDLVYNTNKSNTGRKKDAMKDISDDPENPFGSIVRQVHGPDGKVTSAMNKVYEEGDWDEWSRNFSSQMLSKQNPDFAKQQLGVTHERRLRELDEINSLTNSTVRKDLLLKYADSVDAAAVHLHAAALPRTANKVLLPVTSVKPREIYAPSFRDGERVALVRHPHGGTFEIPSLTVNNRNRTARKIMGTAAKDAVGINHEVAKRLSGADFDGDTVLVIPYKPKTLKTTPALEGLKDFDPQVYKLPKDSPIPRIKPTTKQNEMGKVSNLITDMSLQGASHDEVARAIRHSMVVIDSEKHNLDYRQSHKDNGIAALKEKYQGGRRAGAATLISRAGADVRIPERVPRPARRGGPIDPVTGKKVYEETGRVVPDRKTGRPVLKKEKHERLAVTDDALTLIGTRPTQMEFIYAAHSNTLKALANGARKQALSIKGADRSPSAAKTYSKEVDSLNAKLNIAKRNAPRERQAQRLTETYISQLRQANPEMQREDITKHRFAALENYRNNTGAKKTRINITQREWDAIQAGAISRTKLEEILRNSDADRVKELAMPKQVLKMSSSKRLRAQSMLASGFTQQEIADALGVGLTTLKVSLNE